MRIKSLIVETGALNALAEFYTALMQLTVESAGENEITIRIGRYFFKEWNSRINADPVPTYLRYF